MQDALKKLIKRASRCCLIAGAMLALTAQAASTPPLFFEHLNTSSKSNLNVISIIQDRQGFIWLGTTSGIFRHDGYALTQFKSKLGSAVITQAEIYNLLEDKQGKIWACTDNGIMQLDPKTNTFNQPDLGHNQILSQLTRQIIDDGQGGLWIATHGGLLHFNPDSGFIREYIHDPANADSIATNHLDALTMDDKGGLWIATWPGGIDYLAPKSSSFRHFRVDTSANPDPLLNNVRTLQFDHQHRLWIGTEAGISLWQQGSDWSQKRHLTISPGASRFRVNQIYMDRNATIWAATMGQGLLRWDNGTNQFIRYIHRSENPFSLPDNNLYSVYVDRSDTLWVATNSNSLSRAHLSAKGFDQIFPRDLLKSSPDQENAVYSLASNSDDHLWLGSASGLTLIDIAKRTIIQRFQANPKQPGSLSSNVIYSLYKSKEGPLWIGTSAGLNRLDKPGGPFHVVHLGKTASDFVSHIAPGRNGILWLATGSGLIRYEPKSGAIKHYSHDPNDPYSRSINSTYVSFEDSSGHVWAAGADNGSGLDMLDPVTGKFSHYLHDSNNIASLSDDHVNVVSEDRQGTVWVGTDMGLNRVIFKQNGGVEFRSYQRNGFTSERVSAIESDDTGQLWVTSSSGTFSFNPLTTQLTYFSLGKNFIDGNDRSSLRDNTGKLYFGSRQGVMIVDPVLANIDSFPPQTAITDISVLNHSLRENSHLNGVVLSGTLNKPKALNLSWRNNIFSLEFSALHYADPELNRYAYRLKGFDKYWVYVDAQHRTATYTNLDPGHYVFHVMASNNTGEWREISLPITITPPFWVTWWFRALLAILFIALASVLYRWRIRQLKRNEIRLEILVTERNIEAITLRDEAIAANQAKSDFIANMSHEIRTPMNSILGMAHLALNTEISEKARNYLERIHLSGLHLLGIIEEILDFSKISANKMQLEEIDFELTDLLDSTYILFEPHLKDKSLTCVHHIDPELPACLRGDPLRLGQILINYVSNAVKFTEKGTISVRIRKIDENDQGILVRFEVQDDGIGIDEAAQSRLFQPFQQADTSTTRVYGGTGLGLSICRQLVELMPEGAVGVQSILGTGSTFWFTVRLATGSQPQARKNFADLNLRLDGMRILIADDHPFNCEVASGFLEQAGAIVSIAHHGQQALDQLKGQRFDCLLLDIQMPVMDGFETIRQIRATPELAELPVIAMTASASPEDQHSYLAAGMNGFISKPFDPALLYATLGKWLKTPHHSVTTSETISAAIDLSVLSRWIGDEKIKLREFALKFVNSARMDMKKIDAAFTAGDYAALPTLAHHVSSPARMVGAIRFADLCRILEAQTNEDAAIIAQMHTQLDLIEIQIAQELN